MKLFPIIIFLTFLTISVSAEPYHLKLLAVQDLGNNQYVGSDADLYLELKPGTGRVFLDTYPLTKLDTQISTRFAKEIACNNFQLNCDQYDFIYTIKAKSSIVGGPSAGAAIAALTTIAVLDLPYNQEVTITGTINSGGTIGPVGGIKEKLEAASNAKLKKVLISLGSSHSTIPESKTNLTENKSIDLIQYGKENLSIEVKEISNLDEVIYEITGKDLNHKNITILENEEYKEIMKKVSNILCERTNTIENDFNSKINASVMEEVEKKKNNSQLALEREDYYSAASFCFGNNVNLKTEYYKKNNFNQKELEKAADFLAEEALSKDKELKEKKINTLSGLQTMMVVKERLDEVKQRLRAFEEENDIKQKAIILAYAEERYFSVLAWQEFFAMSGNKFELNQEELNQTCLMKISEAEERFQYVNLFLNPEDIKNIPERIDLAQKALDHGEPELCIIQAAQGKAEANAILSSLGVEDNEIIKILESKNKAVQRVISITNQEKVFPILGYSYYRYANALQEQDKYAALIYYEYALEMSDLQIYFPEEKNIVLRLDSDGVNRLEGFGTGILVMIMIFGLIFYFKNKNCKKKRMRW